MEHYRHTRVLRALLHRAHPVEYFWRLCSSVSFARYMQRGPSRYTHLHRFFRTYVQTYQHTVPFKQHTFHCANNGTGSCRPKDDVISLFFVLLLLLLSMSRRHQQPTSTYYSTYEYAISSSRKKVPRHGQPHPSGIVHRRQVHACVCSSGGSINHCVWQASQRGKSKVPVPVAP